MSDTDVARLYDANAEDEWSRLDARRTEFAVTCRALDEHLPRPPAKILDVGSGPGRYAIRLAQRGYAVSLLDLSQQCLDLAAKKAALGGVRLDAMACGTATDLGMFPAEYFDAVLLLGPLYHLKSVERRRQAVLEAMRVARTGGLLISAYLTRYSVVRYAAKVRPAQLSQAPAFIESILATGVGNAGDGFLNSCYCSDPTEIRPFMDGLGVDTVELIGCEGVVAEVEERLNDLSESDFARWADLNYRLGRRAELLAASAHILHIGRRATASAAGP